jgi:hypothetical protein
MTAALVRPLSAVAWELRTAWASGRRVALSLDEQANERRLEGHVKTVAATDAFVVLGSRHIPLSAVLAVHLPSRLGDSTMRAGDFHGPALRVVPQKEQLW